MLRVGLITLRDCSPLPGDLHRHALVLFTHNLNWLHVVDPKWTETHLLALLDGDDQEDINAFWSGFFWGSRVPNHRLYRRLKTKLLRLGKEGSLSRRGYGEILAGIILAGWGIRNKKTNQSLISNDEMRDVLLRADDDFRSQVLWQVEKWSEAEPDGDGERWAALLPKLLQDVWPRQKSTKTPAVSARLCDIAFSNAERFPEMVAIILPIVTTIDGHYLRFPSLHTSADSIINLHPRDTLALLHAVLPEDVAAWPYGMDSVLHRIGEADSSLSADERLLELKRRWNSR